jgi:hypothetical protein
MGCAILARDGGANRPDESEGPSDGRSFVWCARHGAERRDWRDLVGVVADRWRQQAFRIRAVEARTAETVRVYHVNIVRL